MADICMCVNKDCTLSKNCYRAQATPCEYRQSYSAFKQNVDGKCAYYWPIEEDKENV